MGRERAIIASAKNIGILLDRFSRFVGRNSDKTFEIKSVWGKPAKKNETWSGNPKNYILTQKPGIGKHFSFGSSECLLSVQLHNLTDVVNIHYGGSIGEYERYGSGVFDFSENPVSTNILEDGDKVFFKHNCIVVIPKNNHVAVGKKCSWMLTAN